MKMMPTPSLAGEDDDKEELDAQRRPRLRSKAIEIRSSIEGDKKKRPAAAERSNAHYNALSSSSSFSKIDVALSPFPPHFRRRIACGRRKRKNEKCESAVLAFPLFLF